MATHAASGLSRSDPPSGTVTFLFSDIEGSTQRWESEPAPMQDAVRRHDALMREAIATHDGCIFKTVGDAFCAAFSRAEDGVRTAIDAQRALAAEDFSDVGGLRVRMALHTGTADERDGDYFGPVVNRVARLLATAHGGQVLVSRATADLAEHELPPHTSLHDLGAHRLKDLARPEHVYQLLASGLPERFPPLRSLDAQPNNLPSHLTSFIGRDVEIAEITALVETHRLVTVVGSGGIGKTRTSLQVAAALLTRFPDGVWFIELAPLTNGDYITSAFAQALGVTLPAQGDALDNLLRSVQLKQTLLIVDNCEHLIDSVAVTITALLRRCPKVTVLASSREAIRIDGEEVYRLPSLGVPASSAGLAKSEATESAAVTLFIERATAVDRRFRLSDESAPIIADICRRLDGIPLALELAAARMRILSPRALRDQLDERFRVLTGVRRDVLPRQQTLRALIDWSYDLLAERERALFRRLGVFVDGFTLEGAVSVGSGDDLSEDDVLDVLTSLVDKSLVLVEPARDDSRYRLLESTRAYAAEKLVAANELRTSEERRVRYLLDRLNAAREQWRKTGSRAELARELASELDDIRAALDFAAAYLPVWRAELLVAIGHAWRDVGLDGEGRTRVGVALCERSGIEPELLARLSITAAEFEAAAGRPARAYEVSLDAVRYARESRNARTLPYALVQHALNAITLHKCDEAEKALDEAARFADSSAPLRLRTLHARARLGLERGDLAAAADAFEQLGVGYRAAGEQLFDLRNTYNLAEVEHARGNTGRAIALVREILPLLRSQSDRRSRVNALANLAGYLVACNELVEARAVACEAIGVFADQEPEHTWVAIAIEHLALTLAHSGEHSRAAKLHGYADAVLHRSGFQREFTERTTYERLDLLLQDRLSRDDQLRLIREGEALAPEAAVALAIGEIRPP